MLSKLFVLYLIFKMGLSLNLGLTLWVDWQASKPLESACLTPAHQLRVTDVHHRCPAFTWMLGSNSRASAHVVMTSSTESPRWGC